MQTHAHFFSLPHHKSQYISYLYISSVLRTFVLTSFGIFLPILLIKHYLYLGQTLAVLITIFYFILYYGAHLFSMPLASTISEKFGIRMSAMIGQTLLLCFFLFLGLQQYFISFLVLGFACGLWWFAYHNFFLAVSKHAVIGRRIGMLQALSVLTGIIAPLVGGFVLEYGSKQLFYGYAIICITFSLLSILGFKDFRQIKKVTYKAIWHEIQKREDDFIGIVGHGGELSTYAVAWPLLLFILFTDFFKIAVFSSVIMIVAAALSYGIGKLLDRYDNEKIKKLGIALTSSSWIGKAVLQTPLFLYVFDVLYQLLSSFLDLPMTAIAYQHAKGEVPTYVAFREVAYRVGNIFGLSVLACIVFLHIPLWFIFVYAALMTFLPLRLKG